MGAKGRKSQALLKAQGTYRKDRHGDDESLTALSFIDRKPDPPDTLSDFGSKIWMGIMEQAIELETWLTWSDLTAIEQYCIAADNARQFANEPKIVIKDNGDPMVSPTFKIWKESVQLMHSIAGRYGLDPSSRTQLKFSAKKEDDPADFTKLRL